jgi:2-polyprenyl-3-methyl-5-hydroxy-6-metoxy-1,4-benzoquinol methylase
VRRALALVKRRREALGRRFDVARAFAQLEESCVPSYVHPNWAAALVAWSRLFAAAELHRRFAPAGPVLDFGAATGELRQVLGPVAPYSYIETDEALADALRAEFPDAARHDLDALPPARFAAVFALDSLEHNRDIGAILDKLVASLAPSGVLILSGPTENALYRLGRRISGFNGEYHHATVYDIERLAAERLTLLHRRRTPLGAPLFSLSAWRGRA